MRLLRNTHTSVPISTPERILLPQTFLTPTCNSLRATVALASDHNLTPTADIIHASHSPMPPQTQSHRPHPLHFLAHRQFSGGNSAMQTYTRLFPAERKRLGKHYGGPGQW